MCFLSDLIKLSKHPCGMCSMCADLIEDRDDACCRYVEELIAAEVSAGIPHGKILVAGFSQGPLHGCL